MLASGPGLRRRELGALTPACLELQIDPPALVLAPDDVKNRKPTVQVIRPELAKELREWIETAQIGSESPLWPKLTQHTAKMLKADLEATGIPYVDSAGLFADFHCLRHSFISLITRGGVHPKLAQRLARHSTVELTLADEALALNALPTLPSIFDEATPESQQLRATGTEGENVLPTSLPKTGTKPCNSVHPGAMSDEPATIPFEVGSEQKKARKTRKKPCSGPLQS
ncbi:MAG: tyrosine-type recombinase/integrase [Planctomycetaceae bacterium]|nr:tyrosine-type recombinase/integrase [Planctomycetaceae bacterium]